MDIKLGDLVKDSITGFEGVVICVAEWLHGCRRMTVQPKALKDGRPIESASFDEPQLVLLNQAPPKRKADTGGPRPEPSRQASPLHR